MALIPSQIAFVRRSLKYASIFDWWRNKVCAASFIGISAADTVMVGDTKGDIDSGKANGIATIGVTWGYGSREELLGADQIVDSPNAIAL